MQCSEECLCFNLQQGEEGMKRQAEFKIIDHSNVQVKVKSMNKVPRDFTKTLEHLALILGYGDDTLTSNYVLDSINLLQLDLYNTPA